MMLYKIVEVMRSGQMGREGVRDWRVGGGRGLVRVLVAVALTAVRKWSSGIFVDRRVT